MRLLKRMKPNELREISKAATALEKSKVEDSKKVCVRFWISEFKFGSASDFAGRLLLQYCL